MSVLHLIDAASPSASPVTLALVAEMVRTGERGEHRVVLLGGTALERAAITAGLGRRDYQRISVPGGRALLGLPGAWRQLRRMPQPDVVHAWSLETLALASLLWPRTQRVHVLTLPPTRHEAQWLPRLMNGNSGERTHVLSLRRCWAADLVNAGLPADCITVLPPTAGTNVQMLAEPDAVRSSWQLGDGPTKVVALLSDPPAAADAQVATMAVALTQEAMSAGGWNGRIVLLMHPQQRHRPRSQRMLHDQKMDVLLLQEPRLATPWQVLAGCDAAACFGQGAGGLSLSWARTAGCPVVAGPEPAVLELVEHEATGLVAESGKAKALAHELCRIFTEPALQTRLAGVQEWVNAGVGTNLT